MLLREWNAVRGRLLIIADMVAVRRSELSETGLGSTPPRLTGRFYWCNMTLGAAHLLVDVEHLGWGRMETSRSADTIEAARRYRELT